MKKITYCLAFLLLLIFSTSSVYADTINFEYQYNMANGNSYGQTEEQLTNLIEQKRQSLINYWQQNYSSQYPYYYIALDNSLSTSSNIYLLLVYHSFAPSFSTFNGGLINVGGHSLRVSIYCTSDNNCTDNITNTSSSYYIYPLFYNNTTPVQHFYYLFSYYDSNFNLTFSDGNTFNVVKDNEIILTYSTNDPISTYRDTNYTQPNLVSVNLNDYEYIILSLKDYSLRNNEVNQFYSNVNTLGQLCVTSVYNYGMTEKSEVFPNYIPQQCTEVYTEVTPVRLYVMKQDLENHAVWYLKSYNYSIANTLQIDTTVFDITYVTSSNLSNPTVTISGRNYPVIPYNELTSTAETSTDSGYISGVVCALGDINCMQESTGVTFDDLFSHPLDVLKSLWSSIEVVFSVITQFITILPSQLQNFLILSFMLAIMIGIIRMII